MKVSIYWFPSKKMYNIGEGFHYLFKYCQHEIFQWSDEISSIKTWLCQSMFHLSINNVYLCNTVFSPMLCYFEFSFSDGISIYDINLWLAIIVAETLFFFSIVLLFVALWVFSSCFYLLVEEIGNFRFYHIYFYFYLDLIEI